MVASFGYLYDVRRGGASRSGTAAANATAIQALIDTFAGKGVALSVEEIYACDPLTLKPNVSLVSLQGSRFKGPYTYDGGATQSGSSALPGGGGFKITSTSSPFLSLKGGNTVSNLTFFYPSQAYTATTIAGTTTYPATIANGQATTWGIGVRGCAFVGSTTCIDMNYVSATETSDLEIDLNYAYPIGGYFLRLKNVFDIPRVTRNHVNPGVGSRFLTPQTGNITVKAALVDDVVANGTATFSFDACDDFMASLNFVFGVKTGFYVTGSYGCFVGHSCDQVETGFEIDSVNAIKTVHLGECTVIPSAGPSTSARNGIKFTGAAGNMTVANLRGFLASNTAAVPSSSDPSANALVKVSGSGAQLIDIVNARKGASGGTWANHVQLSNGSATANQTQSS